MLVIRLQRAGRKKLPFYRVVVAEKSSPVKGKFLERVGHYNPLSNPKELVLEQDRVKHWITSGAQPSQTVARLLAKEGIKEVEKFIKDIPSKPSKKELEAEKAKEEVAKAKAEAEAASKEAKEVAAVVVASEEAPAAVETEEEKAEEKMQEEKVEEAKEDKEKSEEEK